MEKYGFTVLHNTESVLCFVVTGLAGSNDFDRAIADSIGESITDIREKYSTAFSESDETRKV